MEESRVLPGLAALILPEALELGELWKYKELKELLNENLIRVNNPEAGKGKKEPDSSPPRPFQSSHHWLKCEMDTKVVLSA